MNNNVIQLSDHFSFGRLIKFTLSPVLMMIFTSTYGVVDGFFVSNFAGAAAFSALNLSMPFLMLIAGIGFMFGAGGVAYVSMKLGQEKIDEANQDFSLIIYTLIFIGAAVSFFGYIFAPVVARLLGADDELLPFSVLYIRINMAGLVFFMLQNTFQNFLISAERPKYGMFIIFAAGITNMILDWVLVGILGFGLKGAAWATVAGQIVGGVVPVVYFLFPSTKNLHLGKTRFNGLTLAKVCANGSSEMVSSVSTSFVGMLFNHQLIKYFGNSGVASYGVLMYVGFIMMAIFIGYSMGVSPVISYNYGAKNNDELHNLFLKSLKLIGTVSLFLTILFELSSPVLTKIFTGYDLNLYNQTLVAFRIFTINFIFAGFNMFGSGFFTALNNGKISAFLSFFRVLIVQTVFIFVFPVLFGAEGLWWVTFGVETVCFAVTLSFWIRYKKVYKY